MMMMMMMMIMVDGKGLASDSRCSNPRKGPEYHLAGWLCGPQCGGSNKKWNCCTDRTGFRSLSESCLPRLRAVLVMLLFRVGIVTYCEEAVSPEEYEVLALGF
jgi:hypothetical protein